jgi:hypothetical protein
MVPTTDARSSLEWDIAANMRRYPAVDCRRISELGEDLKPPSVSSCVQPALYEREEAFGHERTREHHGAK